MLINLIKEEEGGGSAKIIKIFIPIILFYGNNNVCVWEVVWWFLCGFLLLKVIVRGCLGNGVKCVGFVCVLCESF